MQFSSDDQLIIVHHEKFGYFVEYGPCISDSYWIKYSGMNKQKYIDTLIKQYGAYNNCTKEFPRLFFESWEKAAVAKTNFYEPLAIIFKLSTQYEENII